MSVTLATDQLRALCPNGRSEIINGIVEHQAILDRYGISQSPLRMVHFLAQIAHESAHFDTTREYASGAAYEGRKDLGNTQKGDGRRFRGRGLIQLTGRANYAKAEKETGQPLTKKPVLVEKFPLALEVSCLFWKWKGLNRYADRDDIVTITKRINGGTNGLADRKRYYRKARALFMGDHNVTNSRTRDLQNALAEFGYHLGPVDGIPGRLTEAAVMEFQRDREIEIDGIDGPQTWAEIKKAKASGWRRPDPRPEATEDDLVAAGSQTVKDAKAGKTAAGGLGAGTAVIVVTKGIEAAEKANDLSERLLALSPWIIAGVVVIGIAGFVWWKFGKVIENRIKDHQTGANRGR